MPARSIWSGTISFGLVAIPVNLVPAVRYAGAASFHMLHDKDHARLLRRMMCPAENKIVHPEHIQRGFEIEPEKYVVVADEELQALEPKRSQTIEITDFVIAEAINPLYFDRPYYVLPDNADKPYRLLVEALAQSRKIGIARFVMREHEYLVAIRSIESVLVLQTLHYQEEIVKADEFAVQKAQASSKQVKAMVQAVESLAGDFDPQQYKDEYEQRVAKLVKEKLAKHQEVQAPHTAQEPQESQTVDLLQALQASLAKARKKRGAA